MMTRTIVALVLTAAVTASAGEPAAGGPGESGQPVAGSRGGFPAGDLMVSDGTFVAVVGAGSRPVLDFYGYPTTDAYGSILDFRHRGAGFANSVVLGSPVLASGSRLRALVYSSVEVGDGGTAIHAVATGELDDPRQTYQISTTYSLRPDSGIIDIRSRLLNTGMETLEPIRFSLFYEAKSFYVFSPYDPASHRQLQFEVVPGPDGSLAWVDFNPRDEAGEPVAVSLAPGEDQEIRYSLVVNRDGGRLLATVYRLLDVEATPVVIRVDGLADGPFEVVVRDLTGDSVFFRTFRDDPSPVTVALPPGTYTVTGNLFPAVVETVLTVDREATGCTLVNPARGRLRVAIRDAVGNPVPGKVSFFGLHPTRSPYFQPHDPVKSGLAWEETKNSVFPGLAELEVELAVGRYLVTASRGPEHTLDQTVVEVFADQLTTPGFVVERVVDTAGMVAVDPHMHTLWSDGSVSAEERVMSVVAEGVEVAVATDHFHRLDLAPAVRARGLTGYVAVIAGSEISIRNPLDLEYTLDFNLYPLDPGEDGWSAVETLSDEVAPIFDETRKRYPDAVIQINHPRYSSWDYLNSYRLDPDSAASAREGFWTGFDVLEVLNGPSLHSSDNSRTVEDWLNLLARGYFFPAVGSSDAHQIDTEEPGYSRTYAYAADRDLETLDLNAVVDSMRKGRSFVTNGPIVELTVDGRHLPGDTYSTVGGQVEILVDVRAAPWVAVDEARVIVNRETVRVLPVAAAPGAVQRLRQHVRLELARDAFIVVEVAGRSSLYPVVQARLTSGRLVDAVTPYALTNPVFVDVDGNGRFDPPLPETIRSLPSGPE